MMTAAATMSDDAFISSPWLFLLFETSVDRLDEARCDARLPPVLRIEIQRWLRRFHLGERHPLVDHRLDAIADDHQHVAVVADVGSVADPSAPRNDQRAAL